jgi:putative SOS response-associated peptidase YedK
MCGRFSLTVQAPEVSSEFDVAVPDIKSRYNIAPSQDILVIEGSQAKLMKWGFVPSWSKDARALINARSETVFSSPAFRGAAKSRRVLIPADGFFEWKDKVPYYFSTGLVAFAGIYEVHDGVEGVSIITASASDAIKPYHDRMPVILTKKTRSKWLADGVLESYMGKLDVRRVGLTVNKASFDDKSVLDSDVQKKLS